MVERIFVDFKASRFDANGNGAQEATENGIAGVFVLVNIFH